jgi:hypothetical protein
MAHLVALPREVLRTVEQLDRAIMVIAFLP